MKQVDLLRRPLTFIYTPFQIQNWLHLSNTRETRVSGASEEELVFGGFYINTCTWEYKLVSLVFEI